VDQTEKENVGRGFLTQSIKDLNNMLDEAGFSAVPNAATCLVLTAFQSGGSG